MLEKLTEWINSEQSIAAAMLFGSFARTSNAVAAADRSSDVDLHILVRPGAKIETLDWAAILPLLHLHLKVIRPATAGTRKVTLIFAEGEADLVLVPIIWMRVVRVMVSLGVHRRVPPAMSALNKLATIMGGGYRFLKDEGGWAKFYAKIATFPGVRISDAEAQRLADTFLCELLWVMEKVDRGELIAAQRTIHRVLIETNILLLHELRIREGKPTFEQGRRLERLVPHEQLRTVSYGTQLTSNSLKAAAWEAYRGLRVLMSKISPPWAVQPDIGKILALHDASIISNGIRS